MDRRINLPGILFAILAAAIILACAFTPAILAFVKAGLEDGFTFEAFDLGPSDWWTVGMIALFLGLAAVALIAGRVVREGHDGGDVDGRGI